MSWVLLKEESPSRFWSRTVFLLMAMVSLSFSSDLRVGLNLQLNTRPDFQFFELVCILFALFMVLCSPWIILRGRIELENTDHLLVFFLINALFLSFWAEDVLHNISRTKDFFWAIAFYGVLRYGPLSRRAIEVLIRISVLTALFWSMLGIVQWLGLDENFGGEVYRLFLSSRALSKTVVDPFEGEVLHMTFSHGVYLFPQNFIYYLICPFFLSVGLAKKSKVWIFPALIIFIAMLGTLSKTFVLLFLVLVGLYALMCFFRNAAITFGIFAIFAGALVLAVILFGHYSFWERVLGTFVWRLNLWSDASFMLRENSWLLLTGDGTALLASKYSKAGYPNPHNMFIYLLIEYGVVGAFTFFAFMFLRLKQLGTSLNLVATDKPEARTLFWGLLLFVFMGVVDDLFVQTQVTALIFFYLGLLSNMVKQGMLVEAEAHPI